LKIGSLRPAIVLYNEPHPLEEEIGMIQNADIQQRPDMLIVMGTSLGVHGIKRLVKDFAQVVKATNGKVVFINKTKPKHGWSDIIDYHVNSETDRWVEKVLEDWKKMKPEDWNLEGTYRKCDFSNSP
jgi:NAD-dependent histone deacetylase SIR2